MSGYEQTKISVVGYKRIQLQDMDTRGALACISGICNQAAKDWRLAMNAEKKARKTKLEQKASELRRDCESFFLSEYFHDLTGLDGQAVLEGLRKTL